jgi:hypothetical protein
MSTCPKGYGRSARSAEEGVALGEEVAIGLEVIGARHVDAPALEALQAMLEHRPVDLREDVEAHGDLEVGRDADEVAVEGGGQTLSPAPGVEELAGGRDPDVAKPSELEEVMVAGNDRVGAGRKRALENPVVGFVLAHDAHRLLRLNENREVADRRSRLPHPVRGPAKLASQNATDLIEDWRRFATRYRPRRNSWTARSTPASLTPAFRARPAP